MPANIQAFVTGKLFTYQEKIRRSKFIFKQILAIFFYFKFKPCFFKNSAEGILYFEVIINYQYSFPCFF